LVNMRIGFRTNLDGEIVLNRNSVDLRQGLKRPGVGASDGDDWERPGGGAKIAPRPRGLTRSGKRLCLNI
jgi:hypothetical protein